MNPPSPATPSPLGEGWGEGGGRGEGRNLERLKWKSRRGLLELDIVFDRFWKGAGKTMDAGEVAALERLLALPDNDLLDLVMRRAETADAGIRGMVEQLRAA